MAKTALHAAGVSGCKEGGGEAIAHLRQLSSRLLALRKALPNLSKTLDLLTGLSQLNSTRLREWVPREPTPKTSPLSFVVWLLHHHQELAMQTDKSKASIALDVIALCWLHTAVLRSFSDQLPSDFLNRNTYAPGKEIRELSKKKRIPQPIAEGAVKVGYFDWVACISEHDPDSALPRLFKRLQAVQEKPFIRARPRPEKTPSRLDERQLCKSHWYYPRPAELTKLHNFLRRELDPRHESRFRHEAGLIALSLVCCRSVQAVLRWSIHDLKTDRPGENRLKLTEKRVRSYMHLTVKWLKIEHDIRGATACVELPNEIQSWIKFIHPRLGSHKLYHLLPYSPEPWDKRAYDCLAHELGCTAERAELITRDLVPRLLYEQTSNSSLVRFWRADSTNQIDRSDRVALSHYLQLRGKRVCSTFDEALYRAIGSDDRWPLASVAVRLGSAPISDGEVKKILQTLMTARDNAFSPVERHNAVAYLTLFVCILGTGHRRSTGPFPFPWDFFPSEGLVFICDKLVTGSEARFVPLAPTVLAYLEEYAVHLKRLAANLSIPISTRTYAGHIEALLGFEQEAPSIARPTNFTPRAGVFFLLRQDGTISLQKLTTSVLDSFIAQHTGISRTVRRLRTTTAQSLWEQGCSGRAVQAFLGHQPEMHVHGPSSTWSVLDVAEMLTPKIEHYCRTHLEMPKVLEKTWQPSRHYPSLKASPHDPENDVFAPGYEGRKRENEWAKQRARAAIRREMSEYFLSATQSSGIQIDLTEKKRIEERVKDELGSDPIALKKVNAEIEAHFDRLRRNPESQIEIVNRAYYLSAPGPVEISFPRSLQCALVLRSIWEKSVGTPIGVPTFDPVERLAHLAVSLACFDGILAPENVKELVLSAAVKGFEIHGDQLTLRSRIVTHTHDFEFSVQPGIVSTVLILGCTSHPESLSIGWAQVENRVSEILKKLVRLDSSMKWSTSRLCLVFRPYWMIRLPGAMYSISIGEFKGPAADARGEAQLHGKRIPSDISVREYRNIQSGQEKTPQQHALAALKKLFSNARGILEQGTQRRIVQRAKLREGLRSSLAEDALHHGRDTQIVGLLLSFIGRLLESGGPRKSILAFSSIETYFSSIAEEFINQAWAFDFESAESDVLQTLFNSVSEKLDIKCRNQVLRLFCNHLRDELSIPHFSSPWFSPREPVRVRSSLALPHHVSKAVSGLVRQKTENSGNAAIFLAIAHAYGLRRLEVFGLSERRFDTEMPLCLSVNGTQIADLKSPAGRRVVPRSIATDSIDMHIKQAVALARTSSRKIGFLFESPTRDNHIAQVNPIVSTATEALRRATGTATVVPHTLRHSFATLLGLALFAQPKGSGRRLEEMATAYLSPSYSHQTRQILQLPKDWPFGVDAIAVVLGQADSGSFLNVYFHGSHIVIADRCERWQFMQITQVRLGVMLSRERSSLSKLGTKLSTASGPHSFDPSAVVRELVRRLDQLTPAVEAHSDSVETQLRSSGRWELIFRALQYRLEHDLSLDGMKSYAVDGLGMSTEIAGRWIRAYERFVLETAFDDFEPNSSVLLTPIASHQAGVTRGAVEREDFVARAQAWAEANAKNLTRLQQMVDNWKARVRAERPTIVCHSIADFDESLATFLALGAKPEQLDIRLHGDTSGSWLSSIHARYPDVHKSPTRASRGSSRVKMTEVSIAVCQMPKSLVPDGRDLARALVGLYIALHARSQT